MASRKWVDERQDIQKLVITPRLTDDEPDPSGRVKFMLPNDFGISVGSAFNDPFNKQNGNRAIEAATALLGVDRRFGSRVTSLFFNGPEPTEISLELQLEAYYSALDEVIIPTLRMMLLSVGSDMGAETLAEYAENRDSSDSIVASALGRMSGWLSDVGDKFNGLSDLVNVIKGPPKCSVRFGNILYIPDAFISSVGPQFSNVLDNQGMPVSATLSVTVKMVKNPVQSDIIDMFRYASTGNASEGFTR